MLLGKRISYDLIVEMASIYLRCSHHSQVYSRKNHDKGYHQGKAYAHFWALKELGYTKMISPLGKDTMGNDWVLLFKKKPVIEVEGRDFILWMKKRLFNDALDKIRLTTEKWGEKLANDILKKCK